MAAENMKETKPCRICGKMTTGLLFNSKRLAVAVCSKKCQYAYLGTCSSKDEVNMLHYLDSEIEKARWREKMGWATAGIGLLIIAIGFFLSQAAIFILGVLPLTVGTFSTSAFESEIRNLTRLRKRVAI